jgi:flagellar FliL protein
MYYAIDPPLVVNFEDGSVVRFLQISMEIMAHDEKAIDSVQRNHPVIRNNLLLLMSNRNYQSMMTREGKEKLRQEALTEVRAVQKKEGSPDVDDLLFTSFVVQ